MTSPETVAAKSNLPESLQFAGLLGWLSRAGAVFNNWINGIRQTNAKAVLILVLYFGTFLVWAACTLLKITIDFATFALWLGFNAALGGFSMREFKLERETDYGYVTRKNQAPPAVNVTGDSPTVEVKK